MEEQKRHSGFETMRILSMVMIVLMHGIGHGGLGSAAPQGSAAFWIYWLLFILARVSTNCFVMLSGYYLSERKGAVRAGRLFRIGAQVWFYSMLTFCVAVKAGAVPLSAISLLRALLPLTSNGYWFASAYFLMYLSVPVLNAVVQSLDRRQYKTLLLVALLLQSVWGTLFYWATDETFVNNGYSFIWFYTLYFMAAYFRKYRVTVPSGLCLLAYLAASAAGLFNRMLALRVENALHLPSTAIRHWLRSSPRQQCFCCSRISVSARTTGGAGSSGWHRCPLGCICCTTAILPGRCYGSW